LSPKAWLINLFPCIHAGYILVIFIGNNALAVLVQDRGHLRSSEKVSRVQHPWPPALIKKLGPRMRAQHDLSSYVWFSFSNLISRLSCSMSAAHILFTRSVSSTFEKDSGFLMASNRAVKSKLFMIFASNGDKILSRAHGTGGPC
jgi:hypothetical protein